jgi:hypothetical protein
MSKKSTEKEKFEIRHFKDKSSNFWCNNKHYHLNQKGELEFICGGKEDIKETEEMLSYIKRNKKVYSPREQSMFDKEEKEYSKIGFGKYFQETTLSLVATDKRYANWLYQNTTDTKIKNELKELLKK